MRLNHGIDKRSRWLGLAALGALFLAGPAEARSWSRNPVGMAQDYLIITDARADGEQVLLFWMASPMIEETPATKAAIEMLDQYILIGVAHIKADNLGTMTFLPETTPMAADQSGKTIELMDENTLPPAVAGGLTALQSVFARSLGAFGKGMQWYAFDGSSLRPCARGQLSVQFANEKYTYDTPIPGSKAKP